jgi:hypothetical protein
LRESGRGFIVASYNVGVSMVRRKGGRQMHVALQIDLALWGMIICAGIKAAQFF